MQHSTQKLIMDSEIERSKIRVADVVGRRDGSEHVSEYGRMELALQIHLQKKEHY